MKREDVKVVARRRELELFQESANLVVGTEQQHEEASLFLTEQDSQINTHPSLKEFAAKLSNPAMSVRFSEVVFESCESRSNLIDSCLRERA